MPDTSLDAVFGGEAPPTPYGGPRGKGGLVPRRVNVSASSPRGPAGADPWHGSHTASWSWRAGAHPGGTVRKMERPWPEVRAFLSCSGRLFFFFVCVDVVMLLRAAGAQAESVLRSPRPLAGTSPVAPCPHVSSEPRCSNDGGSREAVTAATVPSSRVVGRVPGSVCMTSL